MDMHRLIGAGKQMFGCVKHAVVRVVGGSKLPAGGKTGQVEGEAQTAAGTAKGPPKP